MRPLLLTLLLLTGCVVEQQNPREALRVEVSSYPTDVAPGAEFGIFIDVLDVDDHLETNVTPPAGIRVVEKVGTSFATLAVSVGDDAEGFKEIAVALKDGPRGTVLKLGFTVRQVAGG